MKCLIFIFLFLLIIFIFVDANTKNDSSESSEENINDKNDKENDSVDDDSSKDNMYKFLYKRMKQQATTTVKKKVQAQPYEIPGPMDVLPGRSHNGDYWPVFPFVNQYHGGLDLDPSVTRHFGGDLNVPIPSWGMMDISGHFNNRITDTTTKWGYVSHPVNMLGLSQKDFALLMSDPRLQRNRYAQPTIPIGKVPKSNTPMSCKAPLCNPYTGTFMLGIEHDFGGFDGNDGDIIVPIPVSKGVAYQVPVGGNYYIDLDNVTITYGHQLSPVDPYANPYFLNNDYSHPANRKFLAPEPDAWPRQKRSIIGYMPVVLEESSPFEESQSKKVISKDFKSSTPLRRLRRLTKRETENEGLKIEKSGNFGQGQTPTITQIEGGNHAILQKMEKLIENNHEDDRTIDGGYVVKKQVSAEPNGDNSGPTMKLTLEKYIIPVEAFNNPLFMQPNPSNHWQFPMNENPRMIPENIRREPISMTNFNFDDDQFFENQQMPSHGGWL